MADTPKPIEKMIVAELKAELQKRGLDTKGLKSALYERLKAALESESAGGTEDQSSVKADSVEKITENSEEHKIEINKHVGTEEKMEIQTEKKRKREEEAPQGENIEIESASVEKESSPQAKRRKLNAAEESIEIEGGTGEQQKREEKETKVEQSNNSVEKSPVREVTAKPIESSEDKKVDPVQDNKPKEDTTESTTTTAPVQNQPGPTRLRKSGTPAGRNVLRTETGLLFQLPDKTKASAPPAAAPKKESAIQKKEDTSRGPVKIVPPTRSVVIEKPQAGSSLRREVIIERPSKKNVIVALEDLPKLVITLGKTRSVIVQTDEKIIDLNKSRRVPKSARPATQSLNIRNFMQPFKVDEARKMLEEFGAIDYFWLEGSQCFITYSSVDEATKAREGTYNLIWPIHPTARPLVAEFVTEKDAKDHVNRRQDYIDQRREGNDNNKKDIKQEEEEEEEIIQLDELFKLTKAKPPIYWLPLTEEQIQAKKSRRKV